MCIDNIELRRIYDNVEREWGAEIVCGGPGRIWTGDLFRVREASFGLKWS